MGTFIDPRPKWEQDGLPGPHIEGVSTRRFSLMTDDEIDCIEERALDQTNWVIGAPRPEELSRDCLLLIAELRRYRQSRGWPSGILTSHEPFAYPPDWIDQPFSEPKRPWWRFW